jgi:putative transposase
VRRQCRLLGLARSGVYRQPAAPDPEELTLMRWIDEQYLATSLYGSRRMAAELRLAGRQVNRKRVQRLMRRMGLEALGQSRRPAGRQRCTGSTRTCCAAWRSIDRTRCGLPISPTSRCQTYFSGPLDPG